MFVELPEPPPPGDPLWAAPIAQRIGELLSREHKVAFLYRSPDTSTFRYRVSNVVSALLEATGDVSAAWFAEGELDDIAHLVRHLDALVIARYPWSASLARLVARARAHGVRVVFDCDDLVFHPRYAPVLMDNLGRDPELNRDWDLWYAYMGRLNTALEHSSVVTTTTHELMGRFAAHTPAQVHQVRNVLDQRQQAYSTRLLEAKRRNGWLRDGRVTIGYFSGTPSHAQDFALVVPALVRLMQDDPYVTFRIVGYLDELGELAEFADRVEVLGFQDFVALQHAIAEVEVNIAPLVHNSFTVCKSDLKFFEAAAVGTWTIASSTPPFTTAIEDGVTSRIARAHEWDDALREAVDLARDTDAYAARMNKAADLVHDRYDWRSVATEARRALLPQA